MASNNESPHRRAARDLAPVIREHAGQSERERRLPAPLIEAFIDARLFQMLVPREYGGDEIDYPESLRVLEELGTSDGSAAWNVMIGSGNGRMAASMEPSTARDVFKDPRTVLAAALPIGGEGKKVEGGYRLSGRWPYCSGCQQSAWFMPGFLVRDGEHALRLPDGRLLTFVGVLPKSDWRIVENWDTAGMRGTGSHDIIIEDALVPDSHAFQLIGPSRIAAPLYRMSALTVLGPGVSAVSLGIARHAIQAFMDLAQGKRHSVTNVPVRERPVAQLRLAEAEALVQSARSFFYDWVEVAWATACDARDLSLRERALFRIACVNAAQSAAKAVDLVFSVSGSSAIQASVDIERCWRDVHTAATHVTISESNYEAAGRVLLGMEPGIAIL